MLITYNVSVTISMDEKDFLPASIQSGTNVKVYAQFSPIEDRVASLKDFCTASANKLLTQCLLRLLCKTYHHTASMM